MEDLKINGAVASFTGMPLLSERKMVAMLAIEDLPKQELETFAILAVQFALELKKVLLYETVEELAITDGLTGLYVRRYFFERLKEEHERSKRHKFTFAFLMADIDDFKICNDTYGHLVGDIVLKDTARIMKESVREIDIIGRYGGEEFSLVLPETGLEGARVVAERIRKRIEEHVFKAYDEKLKITISIGIAVYKGGSDSLEELIERSDKALYDAKKAGKNVVRGRDL
jgi:diguanylate cyclase (GGDEF)-like protein